MACVLQDNTWEERRQHVKIHAQSGIRTYDLMFPAATGHSQSHSIYWSDMHTLLAKPYLNLQQDCILLMVVSNRM
jgi:hypothetical protein